MLRAIIRCCSKPTGSSLTTICVRTASFTAREIIQESSDDTGTLLIQFAKHVAIETHRITELPATSIRYSSYYPITDMSYFKRELQRTPADQLPTLITFTFTYRSNADPVKFAYVLNDLDAAALGKLSSMNEDTIWRTLYAFLFLMPNWITRTDFYRAAVRHLANELQENPGKEKFMQLCFYLGLDKKHSAAENGSKLLNNVLKKYLEQYVTELSTLDLAVVCSAAYKTATPINSEAFKQRLTAAVLEMPTEKLNDALLITFLKAMRFQRVHSQEVCEHLCVLLSDEQMLSRLQSRGLAHFLTFFAEHLWDNANCTDVLIKEFIARLRQPFKSTTYEESIRGKDIAMLLWSCAQLNYTLEADDARSIETALLDMATNNEFYATPDQLVDCTLSLWMLGFKSRSLLQECMRSKKRPMSKTKQDQPKVDSRYTVLLSAAAIEQPNWLPSPTKAAFSIDVPLPTYLKKHAETHAEFVKRLEDEQDIETAKIIAPINGINIPCIFIRFATESKQDVFLQLLSEQSLLHFSRVPNAIVRLQMRLIAAMGYQVGALRPEDINQFTSLKEFLIEIEDVPAEQTKKQQTVRNA